MTSSVVELVNSFSSPLSLVGLLIVTTFAAFKVFLDFKESIAEAQIEYEQKIPSSVTSEGVDNLSDLLVQNFRVLNAYYSENLSQSRTSTLASISIAVIGFLVIIAGIMIAFIGNEAILGSVSSAAGIVSEAAALLFFKQNKEFQVQMQESLKKLVSTQYLMTSIALAKELPEEEKSKEISSINSHLRELMDVLHDRK